MRCAACGQLLAEGTKYCPACGAKIEEQQVNGESIGEQAMEHEGTAENTNNSYTIYQQPYTHQVNMPMKWYKFLIYVSLLLTCISNIFVGIQTIMGLHYGDAELAKQVYATYGGLKIVDMIYGVVLILFGIYAFMVRQKLARYRKDAPKHLLILYVAAFIMNAVYLVLGMLIIHQNLMTIDIIVNLALSVLMIIANKVYFDKRGHLFNQ